MLAPLQAGGGGVTPLSRALADRPDDIAGLQVHAMYVVPSDGVDRGFDTDGSIENSAAAFQRWLFGQRTGRPLRLDTSQGSVDVTFHRLVRSDQDVASRGLYARDLIEQELRVAGLIASYKLYAVYYDGTNPVVCGGAAWPPALPGNVATFNLRAWPTGYGQPCFFDGFPPPGGEPRYTDFAMFHDVMHTMGVVGTCAPHHTPSSPGHVSDTNTDLMYAGPLVWKRAVLDAGRDDYFMARIPDCPDLATVGFLAADTEFQLSVVKAGDGSGIVTSTPWPAIDCGTTCSTPFARGTIVSLSGWAEGSSVFGGWAGACTGTAVCLVTMDSAKTVTAHFTAPPPPAPPPPPPPPPSPPPPVRCHVPNVIGMLLANARQRIRARNCSVGRVRSARSSRRRGRVVGQKPRAGTRLPRGAKVHLTVSRGRR